MGGSHIVVEKPGGYILGGRGRFWEGRTYTFVEKGGRPIFWEGGVGRIQLLGRSHTVVEKGIYSGGRGVFWEGRI